MRSDVAEWLGAAVGDVTEAQSERIAAAFDAIESRYADRDEMEERAEARTAAVQVALGVKTLEAISGRWHRAKRAERLRMAGVTGALIATPGSEQSLVERSGAARMTVRRALGRSIFTHRPRTAERGDP